MKKLEQLLRDLGLSDSERHIYLVVLRQGPSTIIQIAQAANMSRVSAHTISEKLLKD